MLKWTTYDGTEATLPPYGVEVLLRLEPPHSRTEIRWVADSKNCWGGHEGFRIFRAGQSWLPIPTDADLEKLEELRVAAERVMQANEDCDEYNVEGRTIEACVGHLFPAVRAYRAAKGE